MTVKKFNELFTELAIKHKFSDAELARRLNVDRSTIGRWRKGTLSPSLTTIKEIADIFGVSPLIFVEEKLGGVEFIDKKLNAEIETIAAHHDGDEWTEEELAELEEFKKFVKMKRQQ